MEEILILKPLVGGLLIGIAASVMLVCNGKIAGISNIFFGVLRPKSSFFGWQFLFIGGLLTGGWITWVLSPTSYTIAVPHSLLSYAVAGLLVGIGTYLANGCTSGHGICGNSRLSVRSMIATLTFMFTGGVSVFVMKHIGEILL
ncbi:YeeE/YedE thiosulfate transporter family protein [Deltaproteobacteria bacterium TL4]